MDDKEKWQKLTLRISRNLHERVRRAAFDYHRSQTDIVVEAVEAWLSGRGYGPDDVNAVNGDSSEEGV